MEKIKADGDVEKILKEGGFFEDTVDMPKKIIEQSKIKIF